ncbi:MAG: hypothetical protein ACRD4D_08675 [Candidatus Acidiferrales bacterium]
MTDRKLHTAPAWRPLRRWLLPVLFLLCAAAPLPAQDMQAEVERILRTPQSRPGQHLARLVELGQPAVPALLEKLRTASHPMVIVQALGRLGDPRATLPLVELLNRTEPFARQAGEFQAQRLILLAALRELGDPRAEPLLRLILLDDRVEMATRLAAATALARLGSPETKAAAASFILEVAEATRRGEYGNLHVSGPFRLTDLDQALFEVGTPETQSLLARRLLESGLAHEELALVELLARRPDAGAVAALLEFCQRTGGELYARLQAAKALVKLGGDHPDVLLLSALEDIHRRLPSPLKEEARQLLDDLRARL